MTFLKWTLKIRCEATGCEAINITELLSSSVFLRPKQPILAEIVVNAHSGSENVQTKKDSRPFRTPAVSNTFRAEVCISWSTTSKEKTTYPNEARYLNRLNFICLQDTSYP